MVIILPAAKNMRSGAAELAGTARTFFHKRAIHGTTEEARLNSVRGFLCDGSGYRRIPHEAISSSAMSELTTARHNRRLTWASDGTALFFFPFLVLNPHS